MIRSIAFRRTAWFLLGIAVILSGLGIYLFSPYGGTWETLVLHCLALLMGLCCIVRSLAYRLWEKY